jgi:signal transduction histidine kinase
VSKLEENHRHLQAVVTDLRRQNEKLWALTEASRVFSEAVGVADVEQILVQRALELAEAETTLLMVLDDHDLILHRAAGRWGGLLQGLIFPVDGGVCARVAREGKALALNPASAGELAAELCLPDTPGSALLAPLSGRDATLGLLAVLHSDGGRFDTGLLQSVQLLAHQGALSLENARLIEALRTQADALRLSQDQLIHNARMATVGRLTAALAHEINNPLQSILGGVQLVLEQTPADFPHRPYLELAASELDRVSDILRRMVGFYRRDEDTRVRTDVNGLVRETLALAEKQLQRHQVAVITDLSEGLPHLPIAPNQFKQVFLNLILNAADAMANGGKLEITTQCEAGWLEIRFADSGPGIAPGELERIFESFYTTKPHGTGLGLSISRDIVIRHNGNLLAESEPGQGAVFRVLLPVEQ